MPLLVTQGNKQGKEKSLNHLNFVVPIRHPSTVRDPKAQYEMIEQTVKSIANQVQPNWTGWIVANVGQRLPDLPDGFNVIFVDFQPEEGIFTARTREQHWSAVRIDKGRRVLQAVKMIPPNQFFMVVDDDDLVSRKLSEFIGSVSTASGFFVADGYVWPGGNANFEPISDFHRRCGTSLLIRAGFSLLHVPGYGAAHEETISELGSHTLVFNRAQRESSSLEPLPFRGAVYRVHSVNSDSTHHGLRLPSELELKSRWLTATLFRRVRTILKHSLRNILRSTSGPTPLSVDLRIEFLG